MKYLFHGIVVFALLGCARPHAASPHADVEPPSLTHAQVERLAVAHCASCHQGSVSRAKPAALAVFDLDHGDWCRGLSAAQFSVFYQRMEGELDDVARRALKDFTERAARLAVR